MRITRTEAIMNGKIMSAMKSRYTILAALVVMAAASCEKEIPYEKAGEGLSQLNIKVSSEATKAQIDEFSVKWSEGDQIAIFDDVDTDAHNFSLVSGAGTGSATFTGEVSTGYTSLWAVSPASAATAFASGTVTLALPASQTASTTCDPAALLAVGKAAESNLSLKNVGSVVRFTISDNNVSKVRFEGNDSEVIAGSVKVNAETGVVTEVVSGETAVELTPASGTFAAGTYEIVLLPANLTKGITVTLTDSSDKAKQKSSANPLNLVRNTLVNLGDLCNGFAFADNLKSFEFSETLVLDIEASGITDVTVDAITDGWTADLSQIASGKVSVTAPAKGTENLEGAIVLNGTNSKSATVKSNTLAVRILGINSKDDLLAFRAAHGGKDDEHTALIADAEAYAASIAPFKSGEWVRLNADIEAITGAEFTNSYCNFIHHLKEQFDGDGHTINLDVTGVNAGAILSFFQHIDVPVKNINFAGQMTQTAKDACAFATLAQQISAAVTVENITSSVNLTTDKSNCVIGGLLSRGIAAAGTLKNSTYSGTIKVSKPTEKIGGVVGAQANDKGEYVTTIDGCTFSGRVEYTSTSHNNASRFGGILGSQERNGVITNCTNSGSMVFNMSCTQIATTSGCGIGGIVGRCNATAAGYTMSTTIKDCAFTGSITFDVAHPDQPKTYINKIIGSPLSGYQTDASTGNVETGTITYNYPSATASFVDPSAVTFDFNQSEDFAITTEDAVNVTVKSAPAGWTVDCTNWSSGSITVTAPDLEAEGFDYAGSVVLEVEAAGGIKFPSENNKRVRMPGIFDAQDLIDFRAAYGCSTDLHTTKAPAGDISPYMIDGEITLTGDITVPNEAMYQGASSAAPYWMMTLVKPLNGNGHTLTFNTSHASRGALIQDVMADVHDLNLAGTIKCTGSNAIMGGLCCYISANGINIKNVKCSATIQNTGSGTSYVGGFVADGRYDATSIESADVTFEKCEFSGSITTSCGVAVGGIAARSIPGKKSMLRFVDCVMSGSIKYTQPAAGNYRIGGIVGDLARQATLVRCSNTGSMVLDANGFAFGSVTTTGRGFGGLIGRNTAQATGYVMSTAVDSPTVTGTMTVNNALSATDDVEGNNYGVLIGRKLCDFTPTGTSNLTTVIAFNYK